MSDGIDRLEATVEVGFKHVNEKLEAIDKKVQTQNGRIGDLETAGATAEAVAKALAENEAKIARHGEIGKELSVRVKLGFLALFGILGAAIIAALATLLTRGVP